jgi:hypothetical protein
MPVSEFVEKSIEGLSPEIRAQIDLLVFHGSEGEEVIFPRWLALRYSLLIASEKNGVPLMIPALVIPSTSQRKILSESLPVESFFLEGIASVEFTSYKTRYGSFYLTVRTDPAALRGEKFFVQNCSGCHGNPPEHSVASPSSPVAQITPQISGLIPSPIGGPMDLPAKSPSVPTLTQLSSPDKTQEFALSGHPPIGKNLKFDAPTTRAVVSYLNAYRVQRLSNP